MDAICMRYGQKVKGIPTYWACGETNSVEWITALDANWAATLQ